MQIWVVTRHQCGISALVSQTSFRGEASGGVAKCRQFSQRTVSVNHIHYATIQLICPFKMLKRRFLQFLVDGCNQGEVAKNVHGNFLLQTLYYGQYQSCE